MTSDCQESDFGVLFDWLKTRRRRKLLEKTFPAAWDAVLREEVRLFGLLTSDEQAKVRGYVQVFVAEKNWEGCGGLKLTDEMKVVIAAQVGLLVLSFKPPPYFDKVLSILVYPNGYVAPRQSVVRGGLVIEEDSERLGEAWYRGPVIVTWTEALASARRENDGRNIVFHEFAHQLDMLNGRHVDGTPPMESHVQLRRWTETMNRHYRQLVEDCRQGRRTILDCYGAVSIVEFFAVATETFFERPTAMQTHLPPLYDVFREFYRQDPAAREQPNSSD
jgi:Mlc titration factor MtfA (ptsG expression regulator)